MKAPPVSIGTGATVAADGGCGGVTISVADDAALPHLFDRFFRIHSAGAGGGRGLGLSLFAAVVKAHEGVVRADNNRPGLKITLALPPRIGCADNIC